MEKYFNLSANQLKELLKAYKSWLANNQNEEEYIYEQKKEVEKIRLTLLDQKYLESVSDKKLISELRAYVRALDGPVGINLGEKRITEELSKLKTSLNYLIESNDDPFEKASQIIEGELKIDYFSRGFWTPIFQARYPDTLVNWNNKTENFLKKIGLNLKTSKLSFTEKYKTISKAFRYLKSLDTSQTFYNLNHLMHYGTEIQEGADLIERLKDQISSIVMQLRREHITDRRISVRRKAEKMARDLISSKVGKFSEADLRELLRLINLDFSDGKEKNNRFSMAYVGHNLNAMIEQLESSNKWIKNLWQAEEQQLVKLLDQYYADKPIKNAGTAFPSLILYLRDASNFNLSFKKMEQRLSELTGFKKSGYSGNQYFEYNSMANDFKKQYNLLPQELDVILCAPKIVNHTGSVFNSSSFELLEQLHENPTRKFYQKHKEAFKKYLEDPFQQLFRHVIASLSPTIHDRLETEKGLFARVIKNDFGKGGAWDFYWGAIYPKGGKRINDPQLFMWINRDGLEFGFYIGEYGTDRRHRFIRNTQANHGVLYNMLNESLGRIDLQYGEHDEFVGGTKGIGIAKSTVSLQDWLKKPEEVGIHAAVFLAKEKVIQHSAEQLSEEIVKTYQALFPLILLAILDDPMPAIAEYAGGRPSIVKNLEYPLAQCAEDTGFSKTTLYKWVKAIERKGQAILYGPPGTGKTFVAEKLAKHLVSGQEGIVDLVQFHPAYAYEDFMEGIRPWTRPDGSLEYKMMDGRFLEFCKAAESKTGTSVLIIDEINRANIARVFGELMYLLEYRNREIPLAGGGKLNIPAQVRIIGTMNTADRSIALVDHALRRRFAFLALYPDYEILKRYQIKEETGFSVEGLIAVLKELNTRISDRNYEIGVSFFLRKDINKQIEDIWRMEIEPYLEEYFFDQLAKVEEFRWNKIADKILS